MANSASQSTGSAGFRDKEKPQEVRKANIVAAKGRSHCFLDIGQELANRSFSGRQRDQNITWTKGNGQNGIYFNEIRDEHNLIGQIKTNKGEVIITNDGHTILQHMAVMHPAAKMVIFW